MVVFVSSTSLCFLQHSWQQITKMLKNTSNGFFHCKSGQKHTWLSSIIAHPGGHFFVLCVREPSSLDDGLCGSAFNCR